MTATEDAPTTGSPKPKRALLIAIFVASLLGTAATFFFYKRYADVWLRHPPRMSACVLVSRRLLANEENVSGSIPHMAPDGNMVYLRPNEDRAVRCMGRYSSSSASLLAAALAEVDPDKRARALAAILREHVSTDPSADSEAVAAWLITTAAFKTLPKTQEIEDLRNELDQRNACRFAMRSTCPSRPPIPLPVWLFGVPSGIGLVVSFGWGGTAIATRARSWWQKRRARKSSKSKNKPETKKDDESKAAD